ncbi:MAG: autotransporter domain-containing protein, partial [Planctomycetaceae bacterium]|nr:autotransporter domain-containing protein [Planctomycetaceae bacterium]
GGTWNNNKTQVGVNNDSKGTINHSSGDHYDNTVDVGIGDANMPNKAEGIVNLNGGNWITDDYAKIGVNATGVGTVTVSDGGQWAINGSGNTLITADKGIGLLEILSSGSNVTVVGNHIIANAASGYGTDHIYSDGVLNIQGNAITGESGKAQLKVDRAGTVTIHNDHIIANNNVSYGSDQVDGVGSQIEILGKMVVAQRGDAGGYYKYYPEGDKDLTHAIYFNNAGNTQLGADSLGGGNYKDPAIWFGSYNLELRLGDNNWSIYEEDAPGLAITSGGNVIVRGTDGVKVAEQDGSYAYILLDSKDSTTQSRWVIAHDLIMGVDNRQNDNRDDAYMRVINGSLVSVGGKVVIAGGAGTEVTVRVNGSFGSNNATLTTANDFTVAQGVVNGAITEGNLYVYDKGQVVVGDNGSANMVIADANKTFGRVHVDGIGSNINVNGQLTVAKAGYAGNKYRYIADTNPTNDNFDDPSYLNKWFDSSHTLSNLADGNNTNDPGLLISRGAVVSSRSGNVATLADSYAYIVIDGNGASEKATKWSVTDDELIIGDSGEAYMRIFNGGLLETTNTTSGNIIIADNDGSTATVRVFKKGAINSAGDLVVARKAGSDGQLYIYDGASGSVGRSMVIADGAGASAQVQVDGGGTKLEVAGRLTVGNLSNAGNYYNENRYNPATETSPNNRDDGYREDPYNLNNPSSKWWFDSPNMNLREFKNYAGNSPGLAITDGGFVLSRSGVVASGDSSDSYVLIDNHYGYNGAAGRQNSRSTWYVEKIVNGTNEQNGNLIIGREGRGFVRVLNGGLLQVDGHTKLNSRNDKNDSAYNSGGVGSLYVVGNGGSMRAEPNKATKDEIPSYVTPYEDGNRSTWVSGKATILGDTGDVIQGGEATIRINNGAYGETYGIYAGYSEGSRGDVSVMGKASELHIYKDKELGTLNYEYSINNIKGSGGLSVSDHALLQLHDEGNITLNGMSLISHNSLLHLNGNSILDSKKYSSKVVNARVEGIGTVTAESGVTFLYDSTYTESLYDPVYKFDNNKLAATVTETTSTQIDAGLYYGWNNKDEYYKRYGQLTFGDRLTLVGNVTTFFDVNSGFPVLGDTVAPVGIPSDQLSDLIVVKRGASSTSTADVLATLSGTLKIHARLTGYFVDEPSFKVVQTEGDNKSGQFVAGRITRMFDKLEVVPYRFFEKPSQEIRRDPNGDDALWVSMKLKKNPFEEAGKSHNEKSVGSALDDIYAKRDEKWLPVLRFFWYLEDPEFLQAYRSFSGEIRAHSLLLPLQNPWTYNQERFGFRPCRNKNHRHGYDKSNLIDPCDMAAMANDVNGCDSYCNKLIKCWHKHKKDVRLWGSYIYDQADYDSDGNAGSFRLNRNGVVFGFDKPTSDGKQYFGLQFAFAKGELDAYLSEAEVDDFNLGIYHGKKIRNVFEWRNFLGMGIESYETSRRLGGGLAYYDWVWDTADGLPPLNPTVTDGHYQYNTENHNGKLRSTFHGYALYANTEIARPFILGTCNQYTIRPYTAIDLVSIWQNSASESGDFKGAEFARLDFLSAANVRVYGRQGITFERNGDHITLHTGLAYQFQMGGRHYSNVDNKFQFGGKKFNIRSVDVGNDFLNLNCGAEWYIGKKRNQFVMINYQALFGKNIVAQSAQLGYQHKF